MALSRRAKITTGVFGLSVTALFAASGSAFASDDKGRTEVVIVEQAPASSALHSPGDCAGKSTTSTVADTR